MTNHIHIDPTAKIEQGAFIGHAPEVRDLPEEQWGKVYIGKNADIRAVVTIDRASSPDALTFIGNDVMLMKGVHVGHDAMIKAGCTLSPGVKVGGHVMLQEGVTVGMNATIHQKVTIGQLCMVGMGCTVIYDIPPFLTVVESPCRILGVNLVGLERAGYSKEQMMDVYNTYEAIRKNGDQAAYMHPEIKKFIEKYPKALLKWKE